MFDELWEKLGRRPSAKTEKKIAEVQRLFTVAGYTGVMPEQVVLLILALYDNTDDAKEEASPWDSVAIGVTVQRETIHGGKRRGTFQGKSVAPVHAGKYAVIFVNGDETDVENWRRDECVIVEPERLEAREEESETPPELKDSVEIDPEGRDETGRLVNPWRPIHADIAIGDIVRWEDPATGERQEAVFRRFEGPTTIIVGVKVRGTANIRVNVSDALCKEAPKAEADVAVSSEG